MKKTFSSLIDCLSSLTLTVIILTVLTLTVCINIVQKEILTLLAHNLPQCKATAINILEFFAFNNLYHSWWFKTLLILFSINLLVCTLKRLPKTIKNLTHFQPANGQSLPSCPFQKETFIFNNPLPEFETKLQGFFSEKWPVPLIFHRDRASFWFTQKGRCAFLGFYLAHLGLLFILIGGIASSTGYQGNAYLREGSVSDKFFIKKGKKKSLKKLDFSLRLDRCEAPLIGEKKNHFKSGSYPSTLTLLKDGQEVKKGTVDGSLTLKYKDIRISQVSLPERDNFVAFISVAGSTHNMYTLRRYETFRVPETGHTILVKNILSSSHLFPQDRFIKTSSVTFPNRTPSSSMEMVILEIYGNNQELLYSSRIYSPKTWRGPFQDRVHEFTLLGIEQDSTDTYLAQLKISYEPGANLIWMSLCTTIVGFFMMFFLSHQKLWVKVEEKDGNYHVTLGGWASRNPESMQDSFKDLRKLVFGQVKASPQVHKGGSHD
jgi:cytochrome c biogenesis protein